MQFHKMIATVALFQSSLMLAVPAKAKPAPGGNKPAAASNSVTLDLEQLRAVQANLQSSEWLSVDFEQNNFKSLRKNTTKVSGKALFAKPALFRWTLLSPVNEEWIYDGKVLLNVDSKEKKALRYNAAAKKGEELRRLVDIVLNLDKLLSSYTLKKAERMGSTVTVDLIPNTKEDLVGIKIILDEKLKYISSVKLMLAKGDYSEFNFSHPTFVKIANEKFSTPEGVKVTDAL